MLGKLFGKNRDEENAQKAEVRAQKMARIAKRVGWLGDNIDEPACPWLGECREHMCRMWDADAGECIIVLAMRRLAQW